MKFFRLGVMADRLLSRFVPTVEAAADCAPGCHPPQDCPPLCGGRSGVMYIDCTVVCDRY